MGHNKRAKPPRRQANPNRRTEARSIMNGTEPQVRRQPTDYQRDWPAIQAELDRTGEDAPRDMPARKRMLKNSAVVLKRLKALPDIATVWKEIDQARKKRSKSLHELAASAEVNPGMVLGWARGDYRGLKGLQNKINKWLDTLPVIHG